MARGGGGWLRALREVAAQQNGKNNRGKEAISEENKLPILILSCNFCM
jgi:hypothetical protein